MKYIFKIILFFLILFLITQTLSIIFIPNISNLKQFAKLRNKAIVQEAKSYFGLSDKEVNKYFGDVK